VDLRIGDEMNQDKAEKEISKIEKLAERIEQYRVEKLEELSFYADKHNHFLELIDRTGFNDETMDLVLLGPAILSRIEIWYAQARKEAYTISGKCRDMQRFYLSVADQGAAARYEEIRSAGGTSTDAKEQSRRIKGRLEEKSAYWEGEYLRWLGVGDSYEQLSNGVKDLYKLAEYEYKLAKNPS
jgi:hypothetical protein